MKGQLANGSLFFIRSTGNAAERKVGRCQMDARQLETTAPLAKMTAVAVVRNIRCPSPPPTL